MKKETKTDIEKVWKPGLFDFIDSVGNSKRDILSEDPSYEKEYNPWMVNQGFSLSLDTIFYANEMNLNPQLSKRIQHDFYLYSLPKRKRFNRWPKKEVHPEEVICLSRYLNCSLREASRMYPLLDQEDIKNIKESTYQGGKINVKREAKGKDA